MNVALVDSHCHLDYPQFSDDLSGTLARAKNAGVGMMVTIGVKLTTFENVRAVAEQSDHIYCTIGVHPHEAGEEGLTSPDALIAKASDPKVIGIGESGLDYFYDNSPREAQQESFRAHIAACRDTGLPLIVHTRDAEADTARIIGEEMGKGVKSQHTYLPFLPTFEESVNHHNVDKYSEDHVDNFEKCVQIP